MNYYRVSEIYPPHLSIQDAPVPASEEQEPSPVTGSGSPVMMTVDDEESTTVGGGTAYLQLANQTQEKPVEERGTGLANTGSGIVIRIDETGQSVGMLDAIPEESVEKEDQALIDMHADNSKAASGGEGEGQASNGGSSDVEVRGEMAGAVDERSGGALPTVTVDEASVRERGDGEGREEGSEAVAEEGGEREGGVEDREQGSGVMPTEVPVAEEVSGESAAAKTESETLHQDEVLVTSVVPRLHLIIM